MKTIPTPPSGCATLWQPGICPPATSMSEASSMSSPPISPATTSATSSPASAAGLSPCGSPGGPLTDLFGQVLVPVRLSLARQEVERPRRISGPHGHRSSLQNDLERSLVSKLPNKELGSIASAMTWVHWVTKSGRRFCRLSLSVQTMRGLGFTLSATPTAAANQACRSMRKWPGCADIEITPEAWRRRMGFPPAWDGCAPTATRSSRKPPPRS